MYQLNNQKFRIKLLLTETVRLSSLLSTNVRYQIRNSRESYIIPNHANFVELTSHQ